MLEPFTAFLRAPFLDHFFVSLSWYNARIKSSFESIPKYWLRKKVSGRNDHTHLDSRHGYYHPCNELPRDWRSDPGWSWNCVHILGTRFSCRYSPSRWIPVKHFRARDGRFGSGRFEIKMAMINVVGEVLTSFPSSQLMVAEQRWFSVPWEDWKVVAADMMKVLGQARGMWLMFEGERNQDIIWFPWVNTKP